MAPETEGIRFDDRGLVPCIAQDRRTGEVLTLAYMNEEALGLTLESGELHLFSRSRAEIWHKGATSGNVQRVHQLRYDCDGDAIVALVDPAGPACHTGERSCFYREIGGAAETGRDAPPAPGEPAPVTFEALPELERTIADRARTGSSTSYTASLLAEPAHIGEKVMEEADEVARAAAGETADRVAEEAADLLYHLAVLLRSRELSVAEALEVLNARRL
jgi:phosphoribosyl-ATP pyrophosphohydrolase/phosphoribosyl-AMP cyclohydrolase